MKTYKLVSLMLLLTLLHPGGVRGDVLRPVAAGESEGRRSPAPPENLVVAVYSGGESRQALALTGIVKCEIGLKDKLVVVDLGTGSGDAVEETSELFRRSGYPEVVSFGVEEIDEIADQNGLAVHRNIIKARISQDLTDPKLLEHKGKVDVVTMHAAVGAEYFNFIRFAFEILQEEGVLIIQPTIHESQRAKEFITAALKSINEETGFNVFYIRRERCAGLFIGGTEKTREAYVVKRDKNPLKIARYIELSTFGDRFTVPERDVLFPSMYRHITAGPKDVFPQRGRKASRAISRPRKVKQNLLAKIQEAVGYIWQAENYADIKRLIYKFKDVTGIGGLISQLSGHDVGNFYGAANELFVAERLVEMIPGSEVIGFRHNINRYEADILLKVYNSPRRRQRRKDLTFPLNNGLYLVEAKYVSSLNDWGEALAAANEDRASAAVSMARWLLGRGIPVGGVILALGGLGIEENYDGKLEAEPDIRFDFKKRRLECSLYSLTLRHDIRSSSLSSQGLSPRPNFEQMIKWSRPVPVTSLALEGLIKRRAAMTAEENI